MAISATTHTILLYLFTIFLDSHRTKFSQITKHFFTELIGLSLLFSLFLRRPSALGTGWEKTMFLLARYTVAAAVFLSALAASAAEDENLSADQVLPACAASSPTGLLVRSMECSRRDVASDLCKVLDLHRGSLAFAHQTR
jgi:hypothetical protein